MVKKFPPLPPSTPPVKIDPEFENYLPPLSQEKFEQLESMIVADKVCRDPLVLWAGENILLDGHNRYKICKKHNIPYTIVKKEFETEDDAKYWMIMTQHSRRNWTDEEETLMMGKAFELQKKSHSQAGAMKGKSLAQNEPSLNTAEKIGKEFGKSAATVKRAATVTNAVETLTEKVDPEFKKKYSEGEHPANTVIVQAAKLADTEPETAKKILDGKTRPFPPCPPVPAKPKEIRDRVGRKIPEGIQALWARRQEALDLLTGLRNVKKAVQAAETSKDKLFSEVNFANFKGHLEQAYVALKVALPYAVCPSCQGELGCKLCCDRKFVSRYRWDIAVPQETKNRIIDLVKKELGENYNEASELSDEGV